MEEVHLVGGTIVTGGKFIVNRRLGVLQTAGKVFFAGRRNRLSDAAAAGCDSAVETSFHARRGRL
jgi:hypothetical protein